MYLRVKFYRCFQSSSEQGIISEIYILEFPREIVLGVISDN